MKIITTDTLAYFKSKYDTEVDGKIKNVEKNITSKIDTEVDEKIKNVEKNITSKIDTEGYFKMYYKSDIDDLNLIFKPGIYFVSPTTISKNILSDYGFVMVLNSSPKGNTGKNMTKQIYFGDSSFNITMRNYVHGNWTAWKTVVLNAQA